MKEDILNQKLVSHLQERLSGYVKRCILEYPYQPPSEKPLLILNLFSSDIERRFVGQQSGVGVYYYEAFISTGRTTELELSGQTLIGYKTLCVIRDKLIDALRNIPSSLREIGVVDIKLTSEFDYGYNEAWDLLTKSVRFVVFIQE